MPSRKRKRSYRALLVSTRRRLHAGYRELEEKKSQLGSGDYGIGTYAITTKPTNLSKLTLGNVYSPLLTTKPEKSVVCANCGHGWTIVTDSNVVRLGSWKEKCPKCGTYQWVEPPLIIG